MKELLGDINDFRRVVDALGDVPLLYRGQANALHGLIPGIGRPHPEYLPSGRLEKRLLKEFIARARKVPGQAALATEWDWLILGQHHGLKTRLLDWTGDWRVAVFFALQPHDEMLRVPFSVFVMPDPTITAYDELPGNPFELGDDYFFQPPDLHPRITGQQAFVSAHANSAMPMDHPKLLQFSFYPFPEMRRMAARALAEVGISAETIYPGLDGICRTLVDQPEVTMHMRLEKPLAKREPDWRPIPASALGTKVGDLRPKLLRERLLRQVLEYTDGSALIGIPCYHRDKFFGRLKYVNRVSNRFVFLKADGATIQLRSTDEPCNELQLEKRHVAYLIPTEPMVIRKIERKRQRNTAARQSALRKRD